MQDKSSKVENFPCEECKRNKNYYSPVKLESTKRTSQQGQLMHSLEQQTILGLENSIRSPSTVLAVINLAITYDLKFILAVECGWYISFCMKIAPINIFLWENSETP